MIIDRIVSKYKSLPTHHEESRKLKPHIHNGHDIPHKLIVEWPERKKKRKEKKKIDQQK